ncbi:MAG TPA: hypothetical protein VJH94_00560 [Candidatus Paceibacterota bacterium]
MPSAGNKIFLVAVVATYVIAIALTYARVYVLHAYPIYYSEEDMPGIPKQLDTLIYWDKTP